MKKSFIKVLSVLLVVTILATSLPFSALATEENTESNQTISTDMGDMSMTATNSFGEMLTDSLSEQTNEQNNGYYISNIEYEGYCALVTFVTQQDCTIRVAVYEEDTGRMVTTASADVLATDTEAIVEFEDELPDYFVLKAFMLDENVAPLCKAYTCNEMTKMYEDFMATTVEDFPEDKVINLDESIDNNFLVMSDETETITTDGKTNILVSYDEETGVYTFGNIDEQIKSLKKDDIFYFDNGNVEELTFIKVGTVTIDGTTAQITEAKTSIEEVFDTVKIGNQLESANFSSDEDYELEDGITYVGAEEIENTDEVTTYGFGDETSITLQHNYTLDKEFKPKEPKKIGKNVELTGSIKIEGSAGISVTGVFKFYISRAFSEVEFTLTPQISINISVNGVGRLEVELKPIDYGPIYGIYVGISPKFIVEASVTASFDATLKFTLGIGYNTTDGLVNKSEKPSFKPEFKIEGRIFIGVDLSPRAYALNEKIAKVELGSEIGAQLTATLSTDNGDNHLCDSCLNGDIDLVGDLTGKLVFGEKTKFEKILSINFLQLKIDIVSFYNSYTYDEFGWGKCPYNSDSPNEDYGTLTDSGTCGENLIWEYYESTGTLVISGTGDMYDFKSNKRPWESYEDNIKTVVINDSVTTIGDMAFYECYSLTSVTIPDSVTSIGYYAFMDTAYYKDTNNWENDVLYIGNHLIEANSSLLGDYKIKDGTRCIATGAFYFCTNITSVTIPDSVTSIDEGAFYYCVSLTGVTIPDSVTSIGDYSFYECTSLTSVTIGDSVTTIGDYAFAYCYSLTGVTIPDSVTEIGGGAFEGCTSLESVTIGDGVTIIGDMAFYECYSLTSVTIGDSVTTIGSNAFYWCSSLTSVTIPDSVTSIGDEAFAYCTNLTGVTIPDSVTSIGGGAFDDTAYHKDTNNWKNNVLYIGNHLIEAKDDISVSYKIKEGTITIAGGAFDECTSLTSVTIPDSVTTIGEYAFAGCTTLTSVTIPDSVTSIGSYAFYLCESLTSIAIPDSVTEIGKGAFFDCGSLTSVTIGDGVTSIGSYAFSHCESLTSVTIPDSVITIGDSAFDMCISLTNIIIPDSVTSIGDGAFSNCYSLTSVTIPDSVTSIGDGAFSNCYSLTSVTIPDSVTTIGEYAFAGCTTLTSVTIPDSVTTIGEYAFRGCDSLTSVTIPDSVTSIDDGAFYYCDSLTDVYYTGTAEQWNNILIGSINEALTYANIHYNYSDNDSPWFDLYSFSSTNSPDTDVHTATVQNSVINNEYICLVLKSSADISNFTDDDILYIDQKTAEDEEITFNYIPKTEDESIIYIIGVFSDSDSVKQEQINPDNELIGDVNSDGKVNQLDRTVFTRYLAKWDGYTENMINMTAADVNGDGKVNQLDRTILTRHIAKWEGYETLPYTK